MVAANGDQHDSGVAAIGEVAPLLLAAGAPRPLTCGFTPSIRID